MDLGINKLNKEQKEAVLHKEGPLLIVAGAGTGKTTVITKKIAYLINEGLASPEEILAVTFTDKAANEMEERVDSLLPIGYLDLWISTFHSFCERILRERGLDIGLSTDFKLIDTAGSWRLIRQNLDKFPLNYYKPLANPTKFINALISHFSRCKDQGILPEDYLKYSEKFKTNLTDLPEDEEKERIKEVAEAYHIYQRLLLENNFLDFGDLIIYTLRLFQKRKNILEEYRKKFKYILVDEFQDTNWAQYELVKMLAAPQNNLTVTADDDQAIYRFRGASYNNIIQFRKDFPNLKEIALIKNYRSTQNILNLSYKFIQANNPDRLEYVSGLNKKLEAVKEEKGIIEYLFFRSLDEEAQGVANKIIEILKKDKEASLNDFVILVRANDSALPFLRALERAGIPYQFLASRGLYSKPIILDVISYLRVLNNSYEDAALFRILNSPVLDFPLEDINKITYYAKARTKSIYESLKDISLIPDISQKAVEKASFLLSLLNRHNLLARERSVSEVFINFLADFGYLKYLTDKEKEKDFDYLNQFYKKIKEFESSALDPSLKNFLDEITMEIESGEQGRLNFDPDKGPEVVKIMTIHGAKGLEFKYVFLVSMVDKRFPAINRREPIEMPQELMKDIIPEGNVHLQEERRLCYVAMTRAKKGLFFTSAEDYGGERKKKPSRFLVEMGFSKENNFSQLEGELKIKKEEDIFLKRQKEKNILPPHFSFSQITAYENCPLQYKFAHILRVPVRGKGTFSFGKTIHNTLYNFLKLFLEKKKTNQKNLFSKEINNQVEVKDIVKLEELIKIYEENWIDEWYEDKIQKEKYYKKGKEILKNFYQEFLKNPPEIARIKGRIALEIPFKLKIGKEIFFGVIDRIDKEEGKIKIIDYKTGDLKEKFSFDDKKQLLIYQIAAEQVFNLQNIELAYYYLEEGKMISFQGTEEEKNKALEKIKEIIEKIKEGDFEPTPGWQCKSCNFKDICPYAKK